MNKTIIALLVLCFTATVGNTCESNLTDKAKNFTTNEIEKTKEFQKNSWEEAKIQTANNIATIKSWFVKN